MIMCVRGNRRSRRVSNYRTRVWVNQYNNVENNYGTVMNFSNETDKWVCDEQDIRQESNDNVPDIAIQVVNVRGDEQPSTLSQESVQESREVAKTSKDSILREFAKGAAIGVAISVVYLLIKNKK